MTTGGTWDGSAEPGAGGVDWLELTPDVESVRPRPSRWTALLLAGFAALTCLGLAAAQLPHVTDRGSERADDDRSAPMPSALPVVGRTVVATASLVSDGRSPRVFVAGIAEPGVGHVDVGLRFAGRQIAQTVVVPTTEGRDEAAPWMVVLDAGPIRAVRDGVVTAEVSWSSAAHAAGSLSIVVAVGDGRGGG